MQNEALPAIVGDHVGDLYDAYSKRLQQLVQLDVRAPETVIEDACQSAWGSLVRHRDRVQHAGARAWLLTTALREAVRMARHDRRDLSLDAELERRPESAAAGTRAVPEELAVQRERLSELRRLPVRQQRLVWLKAAGLSYAEIAAHEGCTLRTVERQLLRANSRIKDLGGANN
jgi:RNA polymerase sigma factor (sigma-70 family)